MSGTPVDLRKHAARIKAECGWMSGGVPEIYHDLLMAAERIDYLNLENAKQRDEISRLSDPEAYKVKT